MAAAAPESVILEEEVVSTHSFKKLGAVSVLPSLAALSALHYEAPAAWTAPVLPIVKSLLACGGQYGLLVVASPGQSNDPSTHGFYHALAHNVLQLIESDRAQQEEEAREKGEEGSGKKADVPISDQVFKFVPVQVTEQKGNTHTAAPRVRAACAEIV